MNARGLTRMSRAEIMRFTLWAERLAPPDLSVEAIRDRLQCSQATAYRYLAEFLKARRAQWV